MQAESFHVITPTDLRPLPNKDEIAVATVLAKYFATDVRFVQKGISHTPDLYLIKQRQYWEIKNVRGNSKRTIENILRTAQYQSENIIISLMRTKMSEAQAVGRIRQCLKNGGVRAKRIVLVTRETKTIVVL